jgi:hypothetical protein
MLLLSRQNGMETEVLMPQNAATCREGGFHPAVLLAFVLLGAVYAALFFRLYPFVPWNCDDWTYLGLFHSMLPSTARWNPARIFPQFFMPLGGYFAAYVLRPLFGLEYLQALTLTCSGLAAAAWLALSVFAYRFFLSVARERVPALLGLLMLNAGFFLANALRLPLVISEPAPTILFYYDLPNILNAVLALALCRVLLDTGDKGSGGASFLAAPLSAQGAQKHARALACGLVIAYFAQFSMTISSAISAIPAGSLLLIRLIRHAKKPAGGMSFRAATGKCTLLDLACFLLVAFWCIAAFHDADGGRFASLSPSRRPFPEILSLHYYALVSCIPGWLWLALAVLLVVNTAILARDKKNGAHDAGNEAMRIFLGMMGLSFVLLAALNIVIFSVSNTGLDNRFLFGLALYFYVLFIVNALFLQKRIPLALAGIVPLPLLLFSGAALAEPWMPRPMFYAEYRKTVVQAWLDEIREADRAGAAEARIRTPTATWPHPKDYLGDRLARTLYHHGITSKHMMIHIEPQDRTQ